MSYFPTDIPFMSDEELIENGLKKPYKKPEIIEKADVVPVVHSTWIEDGDPLILTCGNCGYGVMRYNNTPFCPYCGAKMDGERKE